MKKVLREGICLVLILAMSTGMALAASEEKTIPAYITVPKTVVDVTLNQELNLYSAADSTLLTADSLTVVNNNDIGKLKIESIEVQNYKQWLLVSDATDFAAMGANAKKYSLVANETFDMSTGAYVPGGELLPREQTTIRFDGHTGISSWSKKERVGTLVATVRFV